MEYKAQGTNFYLYYSCSVKVNRICMIIEINECERYKKICFTASLNVISSDTEIEIKLKIRILNYRKTILDNVVDTVRSAVGCLEQESWFYSLKSKRSCLLFSAQTGSGNRQDYHSAGNIGSFARGKAADL